MSTPGAPEPFAAPSMALTVGMMQFVMAVVAIPTFGFVPYLVTFTSARQRPQLALTVVHVLARLSVWAIGMGACGFLGAGISVAVTSRMGLPSAAQSANTRTWIILGGTFLPWVVGFLAYLALSIRLLRIDLLRRRFNPVHRLFANLLAAQIDAFTGSQLGRSLHPSPPFVQPHVYQGPRVGRPAPPG